MRVGITRGDLPGPLFMADLEPTSQTNFPTEPSGQTRYVGRPDPTNVGKALSTAPATLFSGVDIVFPLTINGANDTLLLRTASSGAFTTVTIAHAAYAGMTTLLAAINAGLVAAGIGVVARTSIGLSATLRLTLNTTLLLGPGAVLQNDTIAHGSTANTALGLSDGSSWTVTTAAAAITALLPVGGPLDVSQATVLVTVSYGLSLAQVKAIADAIAPQFVETDVALKSFEVGNLHGYLLASFSPDPSRLPALVLGPALTVVADDGVSVFTSPVPHIAAAAHNTPNPGDLTITGTGMGNSEFIATKVKVTNPTTGFTETLDQRIIASTVSGGTTGLVTATSIVIPASLLGGLGTVAGNKAQVLYTSLASNVFTTT